MRSPDRLIIDRSPGETRIAALEGGILTDLWVDRIGTAPRRVGEIVLGRVTAVRPELNAAFLDIGQGEAFLNLGKKKAPAEGSLLPVAVTTDPAGHKQAQVTRQLAVPGRFMSLQPTETDLAIASAIKAKGKREELKALLAPGKPEDVGLLVHAAAAETDKIHLLTDFGTLLKEWKEVEDAIHAGDGPKMIRPAPSREDSLRALFPEAEIVESKDGAGFEEDGVEDQLVRALERRLMFVNGPILTFDETEALAAIDIDMASATGGPAGWGRLFAEMSEEIAGQIRLRRLSGLVLIDFPRLPQKSDRDLVAESMKTALAGWPEGSDQAEVLGWTRSGVLEITIPRSGRSLSEDFLRPTEQHPRAATVALRALRRLLRETRSIAHPELICSPDVADWLDGPGEKAVEETKARLGGFLRITADESFLLERLEIGPAQR